MVGPTGMLYHIIASDIHAGHDGHGHGYGHLSGSDASVSGCGVKGSQCSRHSGVGVSQLGSYCVSYLRALDCALSRIGDQQASDTPCDDYHREDGGGWGRVRDMSEAELLQAKQAVLLRLASGSPGELAAYGRR